VTVLASPAVPAGPALDVPDAIGRYEIVLELGRGGMAVLYLVRMRSIAGFTKMFAVKRILPHLAADPVFVEMFIAEGRNAARLTPHPNLCMVFELGQVRGELFLVMEYLDGVAWEALGAAAPRDRAGLALAAGVLAQACEGLHHAHTYHDVDGTPLPIIHRDVSPQNLFVSADGTCRVLDFGVSKIATDPRRTRTGVRKGKLPYMAPEQIRGEPLDARADVWAVGVMMWEALTGEPLFDRDTDFLTYQAITEAAIPPVTARVPGASYPAAVDRVIARALARDRDQRHASAAELGHDLVQLAVEVGGDPSRAAIASAVTRLCGEQLAARRRDIADALARLDAAEAAATLPGAPAADADRDAAATVSMAMRKDAIVVRRPRRTRGRWLAGGIALVAIAVGVLAVSVLRTGPEPARSAPPIAAPASEATIAPSPVESPAETPPARASLAPAPSAAGPSASPAPGGSAAGPSVPSSTAPGSPRRVAVHDAGPGASGRATAAPAPLHPRDRAVRSGGDPAPAAASGWYAIDSAPYATIFIDDRRIGDTPLDRIALPAGPHRVRAVLADGRQRTFAVTIAPDQKTSQGTLRW
jgi:hypothetical protein